MSIEPAVYVVVKKKITSEDVRRNAVIPSLSHWLSLLAKICVDYCLINSFPFKLSENVAADLMYVFHRRYGERQ